MARINHLILADGRSLDVGHYNLESSEFDSVVRKGRAAAAKVYGVNLYNAKDAPFCLGSKTYSSARQARENASTRKGNHFGAFEISVTDSDIKLVNGGTGSATYTRYAIWNGTSFEKPSYASAYDARRNARSGAKIVAIGVRGTTVVSVSLV